MYNSPKVYLFKFRPSSHSEDYTLIATYKDEKEAEKAGKALERLLEDMKEKEENYETDWNPDDAYVSVSGNKLWFEVYTAGYLDDVELVIRDAAKPENIELFTNYQELVIRVRVPKGLTVESAMLILSREEAEAVKWFTETCGEPKMVEEDDAVVFEWFYRGEGIYYENTLYIGFEFYVGNRDNWEVE